MIQLNEYDHAAPILILLCVYALNIFLCCWYWFPPTDLIELSPIHSNRVREIDSD